MAVYVDDASRPFGRMKMCHMVADWHSELVQMADRIGVARRHIQKRGTPSEHFDICKAKREEAIRHGAVAVSSRRIVEIVRSKRNHHRGGTDE